MPLVYPSPKFTSCKHFVALRFLSDAAANFFKNVWHKSTYEYEWWVNLFSLNYLSTGCTLHDVLLLAILICIS